MKDSDELDNMDLEIAKILRQLDRYYEKSITNALQRPNVKPHKEKPKKKYIPHRLPKLEREQISKNAERINGLRLTFEEALKQAKMAFEISGVLHRSFLENLNANLAPQLYQYFLDNFPCYELREGTLKSRKKK